GGIGFISSSWGTLWIAKAVLASAHLQIEATLNVVNPIAVGLEIPDDRETPLARTWNRPDEQRTSECQYRAHCAVSPGHLLPAGDLAISVIALGKEILGRLYLLRPTL